MRLRSTETRNQPRQSHTCHIPGSCSKTRYCRRTEYTTLNRKHSTLIWSKSLRYASCLDRGHLHHSLATRYQRIRYSESRLASLRVEVPVTTKDQETCEEAMALRRTPILRSRSSRRTRTWRSRWPRPSRSCEPRSVSTRSKVTCSSKCRLKSKC